MFVPKPPLSILEAIAREEGFYKYSPVLNRPQRNNNPGDLEYHSWQSEFGARRSVDQRFAYFPDVNSGWQCLARLLSFPAYRGKTIEEMVNEFAPGNENDSKQYALNIASWTELTLDTIIDEHLHPVRIA